MREGRGADRSTCGGNLKMSHGVETTGPLERTQEIEPDVWASGRGGCGEAWPAPPIRL